MNILLVGCYGKLASAIIKACSERGHEYSMRVDLSVKIILTSPFLPLQTIYRHQWTLMRLLTILILRAVSTVGSVKKYKSLFYATTGLDKEQMNLLHELSKHVAVFQSANMSLGVNLLIKLCKQAATFLAMTLI